MTAILDWIFEGIANWISSIISGLMDAVSGIFLNALGTDMTAMEEYFPFVTKAFEIMQYLAWTLLFLITVWQLFRSFGGPITEAENPWQLIVRSSLFAFLIGFAKPIFSITLDIARVPYTALMDSTMGPGDFTFAGIQQNLTNGLVTLVSLATIAGTILIIILMVLLGWNYFKLLLETVERYVVVGVLCYTSPLTFAVGGSKATSRIFQSWCRMIGSQLLLLVMNVWFLRAFDSSVGVFVANGGALTTGAGNIFLWFFCALAFLKTAQKFDSYLASLGLTVAQTGSSMGMEMLMATRMIGGFGGGFRSAASVFKGTAGSAANTAVGSAAAGGFMSSLASKFKGNSYVRDAVTDGGSRLGAGGNVGFVGRVFGEIAARNGATLSGESISSVAARPASVSGSIAGEIADRSLTNYMPHLANVAAGSAAVETGALASSTIPMPAVTPIPGGVSEISESLVSKAESFNPRAVMSMAEGEIAPPDSEAVAGPLTGELLESAAMSSDILPNNLSAYLPDDQAPGTITFPDNAMDESIQAGIYDGVSSGAVSPGETSYSGTIITGGHISTTATTPDGKEASVDLYSASQYERPGGPYSVVSASDGSKWYQVASGDGSGAFYSAPNFSGSASEAQLVSATFPSAPEGTMLRTVGDGVIEANCAGELGGQNAEGLSGAVGGNSLWYNSALYQEPDAPHDSIRTSNGVEWYAMQPRASVPDFETAPAYGGVGDMPHGESGRNTGGGAVGSHEAMDTYNRAQFQNFMPGYEQPVSSVDASRHADGLIEIRHADGTGTAFYDKTMYQTPRGDHQVYEDKRDGQWYAIPGTPTVERRPVFENGKPVYDGDTMRTVNVEGVKYKSTLSKFEAPKKRSVNDRKPPNLRKR